MADAQKKKNEAWWVSNPLEFGSSVFGSQNCRIWYNDVIPLLDPRKYQMPVFETTAPSFRLVCKEFENRAKDPQEKFLCDYESTAYLPELNVLFPGTLSRLIVEYLEGVYFWPLGSLWNEVNSVMNMPLEHRAKDARDFDLRLTQTLPLMKVGGFLLEVRSDGKLYVNAMLVRVWPDE